MTPGPGAPSGCGALTVDEVIATLKLSIAAAENLHVSVADIDENASLLEGGLALDSVMLIELITEIEVRLKFKFLEADLRMRSFKSLSTLAQVIVDRLPTRGTSA